MEKKNILKKEDKKKFVYTIDEIYDIIQNDYKLIINFIKKFKFKISKENSYEIFLKNDFSFRDTKDYIFKRKKKYKKEIIKSIKEKKKENKIC